MKSLVAVFSLFFSLNLYSQDIYSTNELAADDESFVSERSDNLIGKRTGARVVNGVAITEGQIRPRRRHENDMDYSKYNPFYWEGRQSGFKVEDASNTEQKNIVFTLKTEWPQDYIPTRGPDFSAIYSGNPSADTEVLRSKFKINLRMKHISDQRVFQATLSKNDLAAYPELQKGEVVTFEFRFFMDESFPGWAEQKRRDPHNISAYYSEFFRIRIGEPGLVIDDPLHTRKAASPLRYSGGWTTIPTVRVEPWKALQQQAFNISEDSTRKFMEGRTWFHTDFESGKHVRDASDDKPVYFFDDDQLARAGYAAPAYNVKSCNACHINNGSSLLPGLNTDIHHTVARTYDAGNGAAHPIFGSQLQTAGREAEGTLAISSHESKLVTLSDGTRITLKKPKFSIRSDSSTSQLLTSVRRPPALIGMGLLDAVPQSTIEALAKQSGGRLHWVGGKVGRFGWKAEKTSLKTQIASALKNDMGVLTEAFPTSDCGEDCRSPKGQLTPQALDRLEAYTALLGVPPRMNPLDPKVQAGEAVFKQLNCQKCHVMEMRTGSSPFPEIADQRIQAFTDFALHDMGPGLADAAKIPNAPYWRTAPLWGLKNVRHANDDHLGDFAAGNISILWSDTHLAAHKNRIQLLHDGRAESLAEAILWHGGAAESSVEAYKKLNRTQRDELEAFLWDL